MNINHDNLGRFSTGKSGNIGARMRKLTISQAASKLLKLGYELGRPEPYEQGKPTVYTLTHKKTGERIKKTTDQIKAMVRGL